MTEEWKERDVPIWEHVDERFVAKEIVEGAVTTQVIRSNPELNREIIMSRHDHHRLNAQALQKQMRQEREQAARMGELYIELGGDAKDLWARGASEAEAG